MTSDTSNPALPPRGSFLPRARRIASLADIVDEILIIRALTLRNLRLKYLRRPGGFLLEFLQPTFVCVLHYFIFEAINKAIPQGIRMEEFIWAGFMVWFVFSQICFGLQWRPPARPPFPGVTVMHMRLAICAWPLIANALFCYVSVFIMFLFGDDIHVPNIPLTCAVLLMAAMLGFGWGLFSEGICRATPILGPVFHFIPWLVFLSSGIYFSVTSVPLQMATVDVYNPMLHLLEYERKAFDRSYPVSLVSLSYPALCSIVVLAAGLIVNRYFRLTVHK